MTTSSVSYTTSWDATFGRVPAFGPLEVKLLQSASAAMKLINDSAQLLEPGSIIKLSVLDDLYLAGKTLADDNSDMDQGPDLKSVLIEIIHGLGTALENARNQAPDRRPRFPPSQADNSNPLFVYEPREEELFYTTTSAMAAILKGVERLPYPGEIHQSIFDDLARAESALENHTTFTDQGRFLQAALLDTIDDLAVALTAALENPQPQTRRVASPPSTPIK